MNKQETRLWLVIRDTLPPAEFGRNVITCRSEDDARQTAQTLALDLRSPFVVYAAVARYRVGVCVDELGARRDGEPYEHTDDGCQF